MKEFDASDEKIVEMLAILAEPIRIRILQLIASAGELRSMDILPEFSITQPTLSHHISVLLEKNLIISRKDGRCVYFSINKDSMKRIASLIEGLNEPPIVKLNIEPVAPKKKSQDKKLSLKKTSSVPMPKSAISSPDIEEIKNKKKKKKNKDKKKKK